MEISARLNLLITKLTKYLFESYFDLEKLQEEWDAADIIRDVNECQELINPPTPPAPPTA
jgi:hypothetical protein